MAHAQTMKQAIDAPASKSTILVRLSGALLLFLQAALLFGLCWYLVQSFEGTCNGQVVSFMEVFECKDGNESEEEARLFVGVIVFLLICFFVAFWLSVAGIAFLFLRGRLFALGLQGLSLFLALVFFSDLQPHTHVAIVASIFMVLYLNSYNVRATFNRSGGN